MNQSKSVIFINFSQTGEKNNLYCHVIGNDMDIKSLLIENFGPVTINQKVLLQITEDNLALLESSYMHNKEYYVQIIKENLDKIQNLN